MRPPTPCAPPPPAPTIHNWQGRAAYELLAAAEYLTQAALHLLLHGNLAYIREKLLFALRRLTGAFHEGLRHSERPSLFDFATSRFPAEQQR
jgi:hypothetical protein